MSSRVLLLHRRRAHTGYRHFPCQSNPYPQPLPSPAPTSGAFARDLNSGALHPSKRRALREWIPPSILSPGFCVREQNSASRANPAPFSGGGILANGNSQFRGNNSSFFDQFPAPPRRVWKSADLFSNPAPFVPFPAGACRSCPRTSARTRRRRGVERPRKQVQVGIRVS